MSRKKNYLTCKRGEYSRQRIKKKERKKVKIQKKKKKAISVYAYLKGEKTSKGELKHVMSHMNWKALMATFGFFGEE